MKKDVHQVKQHRCVIPDVEILSLYSERAFPRHSHDQFGIGVFIQGSHRSWSNIGNVNAVTGDIIMVNPGEIHDGIPATGPRGWHMLYINPDVFIKEWNTNLSTGDLTLKPVAHDPALGLMIQQFFSQSTAGEPDTMAIEEMLMRCLMLAGQHHTLSPRSVSRILRRFSWSKSSSMMPRKKTLPSRGSPTCAISPASSSFAIFPGKWGLHHMLIFCSPGSGWQKNSCRRARGRLMLR